MSQLSSDTPAFSPAYPGTPPDPDRGRRLRVLACVCMASATMPMVFTGPAVALGGIADALHASAASLAWVTNAFMLAFGSCLLAAGALADRMGRRRVFLAGAWLFLVASAALPFATGMAVFNALRGLQGLAGAAVFAGGAAALAQEFEGEARTRAFSWLGTAFGVGLVLGPVTAGALAGAFGWRAIFGLVMGAMGVAVLLGRGALRETRAPAAHAFDTGGAVAFTLALSVLTCAVLAAAQAGWVDPRVVGGLAAAGGLFAVFARIERRGAAPLLDLSLLRYRRFLGIQLLAAAPAYAFVVLLVLLPMRFAGIEGMGAGRAGWMMAALSAPLLVLPLVAGRLARRWPPAVLCGVGLLACAAGLLWLAAARTGLQALPAMVVIGAGISLPWGLMDGLAVSVVPPERAGMAAGIFSTTRVAGEGVALAVVGSVLAGLIQARLPGAAQGHPVAQLLGAGRLEDAMALVPAVAPHALVEAYQAAFSRLAQGLAVVTAATALAVWACLGRGGLGQEGSAPADGGRKTGAGEGNRTLV